jgi:hypothetical protein
MYWTRPKNWDLGFQALFIEPDNWAVAYNGEIIQQEFASYRDAKDTAEQWDIEMKNEWRMRDALRA